MSTNILVTAGVFDRATTVSLDSPLGLSPEGVHLYNFPAVGIIDLETVPGISPSTPIWMQVGNMRQPTNPPAHFTMEVLNGATGQTQPLFQAQADPLAIQWNVLLPQGILLAFDADDAAAGPEGGLLSISLWQFASKEWPYLQCCHKFGPYEETILS